MTTADVLTLTLDKSRRVPTTLAGEPTESWHVIHDDGTVQVGVGAVTPGVFRVTRSGSSETLTVLAGSGTVTTPDGRVADLAPGVVMHYPDGWTGVWDVHEPVRKTYTLVTRLRLRTRIKRRLTGRGRAPRSQGPV